MTSTTLETPALQRTADRLASLLLHGGGHLSEPGRGDLEFEVEVVPAPLTRGEAPSEVWAVDGGQGLVLDARCLQVVITRAARVRFVAGRCALEDEGEVAVHLLGAGESRAAVDALGLGVAPDAGLEGVVNLLRDGAEWRAVRECVDACPAGGMVLVDGDLVPDWRVPSTFVSGLLADATARGVILAGVTKHSSLSRGGAPLVGALELEAGERFGPRATWWAPVARTRTDLAAGGDAEGRQRARGERGGPGLRGLNGDGGLQVVAARLDPSAPFAYRVDLPATVDAETTLSALSAVCADAGFPGYPYPLTVADRLASCPRWLCDDVRYQLDERFDELGLPVEVRERAFADRHAFMERG